MLEALLLGLVALYLVYGALVIVDWLRYELWVHRTFKLWRRGVGS